MSHIAAPAQEILKPTGLQGRGFGRGLHTALDESWNKKHSLAAPASHSSHDATERFRTTKCAKIGFCHCFGSGEQAFHLHCKMVALLRPFLFNKKERKKKDESDKPKVKTPKDYPLPRRVLNQAFLIVKLEPQRPTQVEKLFRSSVSPVPVQSIVMSQWATLANQARIIE